MQRHTTRARLGLAAVGALTVAGFVGQPVAAADAGSDVGVVFATLNSPFWRVINDSLPEVAAQNELNALPTINPEFDAAKQATDIRNLLVQGIGALILVPADSA